MFDLTAPVLTALYYHARILIIVLSSIHIAYSGEPDLLTVYGMVCQCRIEERRAAFGSAPERSSDR